MSMHREADTLVRLNKIIGTKGGEPPLIPISKSTWFAGVKSGRFPQPIRISSRCVAWRMSDIEKLIRGDKP